MNCSWKEEEAHRYAEGMLAPGRRAAFAAHLEGCEVCRARVAEAGRLEGLLRAGLTPVAAPATLASRVAGSVALGRERPRGGLWSRLAGRRALSPVLVGLAAALALVLVSYAVAPGAVMALAQRVLFFVPGLGIKPVGDSTLVATGPVSVQSGELTLTVEALLSDGKQTTVKFELSGLPGGKAGWETQRPGARKPVLRDGEGHEYALETSFSGVGGSPDENIISGEMHFAPLPAGLESVDLAVPLDYYVPLAVVPGADQTEIVAHVPLTPADQSDLPAATPQSAEMSANAITLKVVASTVEEGRTVVLVEGEAAGAPRLIALGRTGGDLASAATLRDDGGRTYRLVPQSSEVTFGGEPLRKDLYFEPVAAGAQQLTLTVPAVQVETEGSADVTIPLAGRQMGETFEVNRTIDLGGFKVVCKSATLVDAQTPGSGEQQPWLYVDVELPAAAGGRMLACFTPGAGTGDSAAGWSMGKGGGEQMDRFGVPVKVGAREVAIHLDKPVVVVQGPWELSFPAGQ